VIEAYNIGKTAQVHPCGLRVKNIELHPDKMDGIMSENKTIILEKDYLNVNEAAMYMGCTTTGFRKMAKAFDIPSAKVPGGRIIYRRNDLCNLNEQYFTAPRIRLEAFDL